MPLAESIFAALSAADSATAAIVGAGEAARVYPTIAPPAAPAPYVAWQLIAAPPDVTFGEPSGSATHLVQFSGVAATYLAARDLAAALIADLDNATLAGGETVLACTPSDGFSESTDQYLRLVEARIFVPAAA